MPQPKHSTSKNRFDGHIASPSSKKSAGNKSRVMGKTNKNINQSQVSKRFVGI